MKRDSWPNAFYCLLVGLFLAACTTETGSPTAAAPPVAPAVPTIDPLLPWTPAATSQPLAPNPQPLTANSRSLAASPLTLAVDPHDRRAVYALLEDWTLWRTLDRGQTWEQLPLPVDQRRPIRDDSIPANALGFQSQPDLRLFAGAPGRLVAQADSNLYRSDDGGMTWRLLLGGVRLWTADEEKGQLLAAWPSLWSSLADGLYVSQDGGNTWQQRYKGDFPNAVLLNLVVDPARPADLWAGTTAGSWRSQDGGRTWESVQAGLGNVLDTYLFTAPGGRLYALAERRVNRFVPESQRNRFVVAELRRDEENPAADTWQPLTGNLADFTDCPPADGSPYLTLDFCGFYAFLADPGTPAWLYLAAGDGLLISEDGGRNWRAYLPGRGAVYRMAAVGGDLTLFYLWADVGLVVTNDPGAR